MALCSGCGCADIFFRVLDLTNRPTGDRSADEQRREGRSLLALLAQTQGGSGRRGVQFYLKRLGFQDRRINVR